MYDVIHVSLCKRNTYQVNVYLSPNVHVCLSKVMVCHTTMQFLSLLYSAMVKVKSAYEPSGSSGRSLSRFQ